VEWGSRAANSIRGVTPWLRSNGCEQGSAQLFVTSRLRILDQVDRVKRV